MRLLRFYSMLLLGTLSYSASAQNEYLKSASWESELPVARHRYNYSLTGQKGLLRKNTYKFFPTGSGHTGELYQCYRLFQLNDQDDLNAFKTLKINYPEEAVLTHLDYRVWKDNMIIYEGKPRSIHKQISDSVFDINTGRLSGFTLSLASIEPQVVVEVFYQAQGVNLPFWLEFQDSLSWQKSVQEIQIISSDPLQFVHHPTVVAHENRNYDELVYSFVAENVKPKPAISGAFFADTSRPFLAVEWKDLVQRYDREKINTWFDFLPFLFFNDEIKHLSVYLSSEARYLGETIHSGAAYLPPKRYHKRDEELHENFKQAWGRYRLGKAYAAPLVALQEWVKDLADSPTVSEMAGLKLIDEALRGYVNSGLKDLKRPPYAFYDHGILSKFYTDFMRLRGMKYYPVLLKSGNKGPFLDSLISTRQVDAIALFFEHKGERNTIFLGPYLGNYYGLNALPSDFSAGTAIVFDIAEKSYSKEKLPKFNIPKTGFELQEEIQLSFKYNWLRSAKRYKLFGNFKNKTYHAYLQNDTAHDVLTATKWQVSNNARGNKDELEFKTEQLRRTEDTMPYVLNLEKALMAELAAASESYIFPSPLFINLKFKLIADRDFDISPWPDVQIEESDLYALAINTKRIGDKELLVELSLTVEEHIVEEEEAKKFSQIVRLLQEGILIKIFPKNEP